MSKRVSNVLKFQPKSCSWDEALEGFLFWKKAQGMSKVTVKGYKDTIMGFYRRLYLSTEISAM